MSTEEREAAVQRAASVESHPPPVCLESRLVDLEEECRRDTCMLLITSEGLNVRVFNIYTSCQRDIVEVG